MTAGTSSSTRCRRPRMRPDRVMWAVGLVVAGAVLAGLVLNLAGGLTRLSWAITLAVAVLCWAGAWLAAVTWVRAAVARPRAGAGLHPGRPRQLPGAPYVPLGAAQRRDDGRELG